MENPKFKTKRELIQELGLSKSTFYRLLQKKNISSSPELLSPRDEQELREALGVVVKGVLKNEVELSIGFWGSIPE